MIVSAMLPWFDEPVALLRQAVDGAAVLCDAIVAADGGYELVEDARESSPPAQKKAIQAQADKHGLKCSFLRPQIYAGQVAKRDALLQVAKIDSDWVLTLDADWKISGDRKEIRSELRALEANGYQQVALKFFQPDNPARGPEKYANTWHIGETEQWRELPLLYRVMPVMHYQQDHWRIYTEDDEGNRIGMWGGAGLTGCAQAKTAYLQAEHLVEHRCLFRAQKQIERNRDYIVKRDAEVARTGRET